MYLDNLGSLVHYAPASIDYLGTPENLLMPTPDTKLLQGTLDMLILKALSVGALHGYGIGQRIVQMSDDVLRVEEGSLYPALYRIERQGWITSEWGVSENNLRAKFYKLTRAGRKQLQVEEENWGRLAEAVFKVMRTA
ncbi:MAG TPA: PadR family transcriptional regulator [Pyrinomonadaceae bacterium]|nr:PadR family transcriptional regulator [Pyrinomonadaceae bacterium]